MADIKYYDVILKPVITEKSMAGMGEKNKRRGMVVGKTAKTKKAIVTLTADSKDIEIFAGL